MFVVRDPISYKIIEFFLQQYGKKLKVLQVNYCIQNLNMYCVILIMTFFRGINCYLNNWA
jgi:hypothetical protein